MRHLKRQPVKLKGIDAKTRNKVGKEAPSVQQALDNAVGTGKLALKKGVYKSNY